MVQGKNIGKPIASKAGGVWESKMVASTIFGKLLSQALIEIHNLLVWVLLMLLMVDSFLLFVQRHLEPKMLS